MSRWTHYTLTYCRIVLSQYSASWTLYIDISQLSQYSALIQWPCHNAICNKLTFYQRPQPTLAVALPARRDGNAIEVFFEDFKNVFASAYYVKNSDFGKSRFQRPHLSMMMRSVGHKNLPTCIHQFLPIFPKKLWGRFTWNFKKIDLSFLGKIGKI